MECEGSCQEHTGEVKTVLVSSEWWKPTKFNYCDAAIEEDRSRGFDVRILLNSEQEPERSVATEDASSTDDGKQK